MTPDPLMVFLDGSAFVFGTLIGSFLNVCIARMPEDRSVVSPPSHCPLCGHPIRPYDNVPILSWLVLRGRCRDCQSSISSLYPTIELVSGLLAWLLFRTVVPGVEQLDTAHLVAFAFQFSFVAMLLAQAFIDIRYYIIPDEFSIYAIPYAIGGVALISWLGYPDAMTWKVSVIGALVGGGLLGGVTLTWWLLRRTEGMGWGDVKLLALIGAMLGPWPALPFVMMVSATSAVVVGLPLNIIRGNARYALPFGPFLALGSILYLLHGEGLMERWFPGSGLFAEMIRQALS